MRWFDPIASFAALAVLSGAAFADPTPASVRGEIDAMLNRLEASGCQFQRNGRWHDGARARSHLLDKLAYIEKRGTVQSAEQFIELAASRSSVSGRPYQVRCGGEGAVDSRQWLGEQLSRIRAASRGTRP
jgi:hypothetical protein